MLVVGAYNEIYVQAMGSRLFLVEGENRDWLLVKIVDKMLDIIFAFWEKKTDFQEGEGDGGSWAFVAPFEIKILLDYRPKKSENMLNHFTFWDQNRI